MKSFTTRIAFASVIAFLFTILLSTNSFASSDYFLKLEGVNGEGTYQAQIDPQTGDCIITNVPAGTYKAVVVASAETFATWGALSGASSIEVSSFSWGVSQTSSVGHGTGLGAGKASFSDLSVMKTTGKSSPELFRGAAAQPATNGFRQKSCKLYVRKQGNDQKDYYTINMQNITLSGSNENPSESVSRVKAGYDVKANVKM